MLTRRKLIMGAVATALVGLGATPALARDERLLADILYGVSDALVRDYIRDRYEDGRWTATTGTTADTATRRTSTAATGLRNITASRRRSPRSARSRIRSPRDWDDDDDDDDDRRRPPPAAPASTSLGMTGAEGPDPGGRGLPETSRRQRLRRGVRCLSLGRL